MEGSKRKKAKVHMSKAQVLVSTISISFGLVQAAAEAAAAARAPAAGTGAMHQAAQLCPLPPGFRRVCRGAAFYGAHLGGCPGESRSADARLVLEYQATLTACERGIATSTCRLSTLTSPARITPRRRLEL